MSDPLPVIPLQYATPVAEPHRRRVSAATATVAAWTGWAAAAVAVALIPTVSVESVLVTGPVLFALGILCLVAGLRARRPWAVAAGLGHCAVCTLFVMLVNVLHWGPSRAREPFLWMGALYTAAALPLAILAARRTRRPDAIVAEEV
jgi:hypothetical protein